MNAVVPTSDSWEHPMDGATPPDVFSRWMKVTFESTSPPSGPASAPVLWRTSQGTEFFATKRASNDGGWNSFAQTVLVSRECCHVTRIAPSSDGFEPGSGFLFGLKKWVVSCASSSLNSVASGVNSVNAKPE